jgi:DNA-directed RNA polymerase specialized sigma54-like protein
MALPARFDYPTRMRIKHAASRMGLSTSGIIRFAVKQQLAAIERGVITLADCGPGLSPPSDN